MTDDLRPIPVGGEPLPLHSPTTAKPQARRTTDKAHGYPTKRTSGNRFAVLNSFVDNTAGGLSRSEVLVWLLLYRDSKPDGIARTSQADLARRAKADLSTIKRATTKLQRKGLLIVVRRGNLQQGPSAYRVMPLSSAT